VGNRYYQVIFIELMTVFSVAPKFPVDHRLVIVAISGVNHIAHGTGITQTEGTKLLRRMTALYSASS
jgi:hypothetical protein